MDDTVYLFIKIEIKKSGKRDSNFQPSDHLVRYLRNIFKIKSLTEFFVRFYEIYNMMILRKELLAGVIFEVEMVWALEVATWLNPF